MIEYWGGESRKVFADVYIKQEEAVIIFTLEPKTDSQESRYVVKLPILERKGEE